MQSFQESLGNAGNIAYIDVDKDEHLAHIRCLNAESAKSVATAGIGGYTLKLLQGIRGIHSTWKVNASLTDRNM